MAGKLPLVALWSVERIECPYEGTRKLTCTRVSTFEVASMELTPTHTRNSKIQFSAHSMGTSHSSLLPPATACDERIELYPKVITHAHIHMQSVHMQQHTCVVSYEERQKNAKELRKMLFVKK